MEAAASNMIPEIAVMIGAFLDLPTIAHCTLVSKSWHAAFIPPLYRHVDYALDIDKHSTLNNVGSIHSNESRLNGFQRHGHHIRALTVSRQTGFPDPDIFGVDCRYLTELDLHLSSSPWTTNQTHDTYTYPDPAPRPTTLSKTHLVKLIDRNPNIQTLRIKGSQATKRYLLEAGLLRGLHLHALKTLDLNMGSQFSPELMREILDYGSGLEQLTCCKDDDLRSVIEQYRDTDTNNNNNNNNNIELATEYNGSHRTPWHRLRTLRLYNIPGPWIEDLVRLSPNLERLELRPSYNSDWCSILTQLLLHTCYGSMSSTVDLSNHVVCSSFRLQHLDLDGIDGEAEFNVLSEILKRYSSLTRSPSLDSTGLRTFRMFIAPSDIVELLCEYHAASLEEVVINKCESKSVQRLLTSCTKLRHLEIGSEVLMKDLLEGDEGDVVPWVCQGLEVLEVSFAQCSDRVLYPVMAKRTSPPPEEVAERSLHQKLWTQIGKMKQLHHLHVYTQYLQEDYAPRCLLISYGGIEQLVKLKKLKELKFCGCQYHLIKEDVDLLQRLMPRLHQEIITLSLSDINLE